MPKTPPNAAAVTEKTTVDMQTAEKSARIPTKHDMTYNIKKYKMPVKNPNIRPRILLSFALINPPIQLLKIVIATTDEEHIFSEVDHKREILAKISIIITLMKSAIIADNITFLTDFKLKMLLKTKPPFKYNVCTTIFKEGFIYSEIILRFLLRLRHRYLLPHFYHHYLF